MANVIPLHSKKVNRLTQMLLGRERERFFCNFLLKSGCRDFSTKNWVGRASQPDFDCCCYCKRTLCKHTRARAPSLSHLTHTAGSRLALTTQFFAEKSRYRRGGGGPLNNAAAGWHKPLNSLLAAAILKMETAKKYYRRGGEGGTHWALAIIKNCSNTLEIRGM